MLAHELPGLITHLNKTAEKLEAYYQKQPAMPLDTLATHVVVAAEVYIDGLSEQQIISDIRLQRLSNAVRTYLQELKR